MNLLKPREVYKPFEYPKAFDFWEKQQNAHWLPSEVSLAGDIKNWKEDLVQSERDVYGQILKSFTQIELVVGNDYWRHLGNLIRKPEIQMMCAAFSNMETIHTQAYSYLNDSLGLDNYEAFLQDETSVAKLDKLKNIKGKSKRDIARRLAIFSGFTEGVNLFSSFAILISLSRYNLMGGMKNIIEWSALDEDLHSRAGIWLFNTLISENPDIWDKELKSEIYEAARVSVQLEDDFIDKAFSLGTIRGLDHRDVKNYIRNRANDKLVSMGLKTNWKNIDQESLKKMDWFEEMVFGQNLSDFFHARVTDYSKSNISVDNLFKGYDIE